MKNPGLLLAPFACALGSGAIAQAPAAGPSSPPCRATEVARNLDFWVGDWEVFVGSQLVGTDRVERILNGCAIIEHWRDTAGEEGISLFGYDARHDLWTQNWVTPDTSRPGGNQVQGVARP